MIALTVFQRPIDRLPAIATSSRRTRIVLALLSSLLLLHMYQFISLRLGVDKNESKNTSSESLSPEGCKLLWFAGMSVLAFSDCIHKRGVDNDIASIVTTPELFGYELTYAAALETVMAKSGNTLQPILVMNERSQLHKNPTESLFGKYCSSKGVVTIPITELSFQEEVDRLWHSTDKDDPHRVGPFIRMDLPSIIEKHKLFDISGVCQRYVLYTDSDVIFPNSIEREDLEYLHRLVSSSNETVVAYGPDKYIHEGPINTGVMVIDIPRFKIEMPKMLEFARKRKKQFIFYDQGWINAYFNRHSMKEKRKMLSPLWNWKLYWKSPENWNDIKVIHFHGPKPGKGLEDIVAGRRKDKDLKIPEYRQFVQWAIQNDHARAATISLHIVQNATNQAEEFMKETCSRLIN